LGIALIVVEFVVADSTRRRCTVSIIIVAAAVVG